ncbi:hypothetical protein D3C79_979210 [compost metagenome]
MNQAERRGVRADDETGNDVAQHYWLLEAMKQNGHYPGDQHDHCQILDEADGMHGAILLFVARANRSSAKENPSEQQVHTVLNAGRPMLHGRTQVNIAPLCKKPVQYVETDRLEKRR